MTQKEAVSERRAASVIDLCGQELCMENATCSFVWPGRGRSFACAKHIAKAYQVASALGLPIESLDVQLVPREDGEL